MSHIPSVIANELSVVEYQVAAAIQLLDEGSTVPFIARYRKEATGSLDDNQLRKLEERLRYLRELEDRRQTILNAIQEQDKLSPALQAEILAANTKNRLEDLYLPYKPKRRTKGQIAIEAGLEALAIDLWRNPQLNPEQEAAKYLAPKHKINRVKEALDGAKYILMERFSEDADLLEKIRFCQWQNGHIQVKVVAGKEQEGSKFQDYFEHQEPLKSIPSHRTLAILRGRNEGILTTAIRLPDEDPADRKAIHPCETLIAEHFAISNTGRPADRWLQEVVRWTWRVKISTYIETELISKIRENAEAEAIKVFASNMKDLLLAAPAGPRATIGLDPGLRTGVKVAVVDNTGKVVDHTTIYPHAPKNQWHRSIDTIARLCQKHGVSLVSIGNGTASRETDKLVAACIEQYPELNLTKVIVNEAGASVYSASEFAAREMPDLDVTIRGAVSIARRLQDPLAELVKIEPKSIGVGQYQHDVNQSQLSRTLDTVVEDCVNAVGVDLNTASAPLLTRVSGLNPAIADNIVEFRNSNGKFSNRKQLKKVARLGAKTFEQAAGFLRVMDGDNALDASGVHPEAYALVEKIAANEQKTVQSLIGDSHFIKGIDAKAYVTDRFGLPTIADILKELDKPGRDPRPEFKTAEFQEGVDNIKDLSTGMILEGSVTNVTNFGAFVDIGVHQDGLVHISMIASQFVKDPRDVVKTGDIVKVKVLEVDVPRKRISLSMRLDETPIEKNQGVRHRQPENAEHNRTRAQRKDTPNAFAQAFAKAKQKKPNA